MKTIIALMVAATTFLSCSGESTTELSNSSAESENDSSADAPNSDKETEIEITFSSGILKGTHVFKPDPSNAMSQINVGFSDNVSNFSATGLVSSDDKYILVLTRPFHGEASVGTHKAKEYTNECGLFIITPKEGNGEIDRINGFYQNCTETNVSASGEWEEGSIYNRRGVVADFKDNARLEIQYKDAPEKIETSDVSVTIKARESRIK
jgi:hypothetical protein